MSESTEVARPAPPQLADVAAMSDADLERMYRVAKALALSKRFPDARTADEAFAKVLLGRDLGMSPTQAMTGIHIVEGKPQIAAVSLAGFVRKSADYDYKVRDLSEESCSIVFYYRGERIHGLGPDGEEGVSTFTITKARRAGLKVDDPRSNWGKYPENMLFARAMSNGVKWFCPDLMGGVPIYTEGDTFEGTASEIGTGHGDGSEPGWGDMSAENVTAVEAIIERAQALGHAGLSDRATAQMTLSGQPDSVVAMWTARARVELDEFEMVGKASVGTAQNDAEPGEDVTVVLGKSPEALRRDLDAVLDRIAAEEEAGADEAVMAPLYAEQARLERLLGDELGDEGQEAMPL